MTDRLERLVGWRWVEEGAGGIQIGGSGSGGGGSDVAYDGKHDEKGGQDEAVAVVAEAPAAVPCPRDEVTEVVAAVLNQMRAPLGLDAVLARMEQRDRSLTGRLDRIDEELRRLGGQAARPNPFDGQDGAGSTPVDEIAAVERLRWVVETLAEVARRQDELGTAIDRRLSAMEGKLNEGATGGRAPSPPAEVTEEASRRLSELRAERARVQERLREERLLAGQPPVGGDLGEDLDDPAAASPEDGSPIWPQRDRVVWPQHGPRRGEAGRRR